MDHRQKFTRYPGKRELFRASLDAMRAGLEAQEVIADMVRRGLIVPFPNGEFKITRAGREMAACFHRAVTQ